MPSQEYLQECFDYDSETGILKWKVRPREHFSTDLSWKSANFCRAGKVAGNVHKTSDYLTVGVNGKGYFLHRIVFKLHHGFEPMDVDHEDHNKQNNRIKNLKSKNHAENSKNLSLSKRNKTGVPGLYWYKRSRKWVAQARHKKKLYHLGYFTDIEQARKVVETFHKENGFHENHGK